MNPRIRILTLAAVRQGRVYRILSIDGDEAVCRRIMALGFHAGDRVEAGPRGILGGPVLVTNLETGAAVALARSVAGLVRVRADGGADG
jgi:Fe2+ transport system protein FeoA